MGYYTIISFHRGKGDMRVQMSGYSWNKKVKRIARKLHQENGGVVEIFKGLKGHLIERLEEE